MYNVKKGNERKSEMIFLGCDIILPLRKSLESWQLDMAQRGVG